MRELDKQKMKKIWAYRIYSDLESGRLFEVGAYSLILPTGWELIRLCMPCLHLRKVELLITIKTETFTSVLLVQLDFGVSGAEWK